MNNCLLHALKRDNKGRPPVWLMRQAGRYLPEYRTIRQKYSFMEMCRTPELAVEITLQPIRRFGFDAAIFFSDILVIPHALGLGLHFGEGMGPVFERPLRDERDLVHLPAIEIKDSLHYVFEGMRLLKPQLKVPLLGFAGAPFTVASYMIEGCANRDLRKTKRWMLHHPESFHRLLLLLAHYTVDYLIEQTKAGAVAVQLFESWAQVLAYSHFKEFSLPYLKIIVDALHKQEIPIILFARGSSLFAPELAALHPTALSMDWNANLSSLRHQLGNSLALQGNLDPHILLSVTSVVKRETRSLLKSMQGDPAFILNLGHGILPETSLDAVQALVDTVHE